MTIVEIPLDGNEETEIIPNNSENVLENTFENEEILEETKEIPGEPEELNPEPLEPIPETVEEVPAPKRPRGRPKGSTKAKEAAPPKPQRPKQPKQAKPKKAPKRVVHYEESDEEDEELPEYVRQEVGIPVHAPQPQFRSQSDMAASMMMMLQNHNNARVQRKQNLYDSWFQHHY